jgi:transcriptional regulator with XRE-family HTH domain
MSKHTGDSKATALGTYLADLRNAKQMKLREVEQATDNAISNAYLSQLETGKISKPSPNILYHLAEVYGVSYDVLMEKAGYIVSSSNTPKQKRHGKAATFAVEDLTPDEEAELLKYLAFIRSRK